jgi:PhnB protein
MPTQSVRFIPEGYTTVTPYLSVKKCDEAIAFYKKAFNASELYRLNTPDGEVGHAELKIGNSRIMLGDADIPDSIGGTATSNVLYVEDCDSLFKQALAAGGKQTLAMEDKFWGDRSGTFSDPYGHKWSVCTHKEDVSPQELERRYRESLRK